jgi:hypothetical protein
MVAPPRTIDVQESDESFRRRTNIVKEILSTEQTYVSMLETMVTVFRMPLLNWARSKQAEQKSFRRMASEALGKAPDVSADDVLQLFGNLDTVLQLHQTLFSELSARIGNWHRSQRIGDVFLNVAPWLRLYVDYSNNYNDALERYDRYCHASSAFAEAVHACGERAKAAVGISELKNFLIQPIQRLPRYNLLLADLLRHMPDGHCDAAALQESLVEIERVSSFLDEQLHDAKATACLMAQARSMSSPSAAAVFIKPHRKLVHEGIVRHAPPGESKLRKIHFWLFNDALAHIEGSSAGSMSSSSSSSSSSSAISSSSSVSLGKEKNYWSLSLLWIERLDVATLRANTSLKDKWADRHAHGFRLIGPDGQYELRFESAAELTRWIDMLEAGMRASLQALGAHYTVDSDYRIGEHRFVANGPHYEGEWKRGALDGSGTLRFFGNTYVGAFRQNKRSGVGVLEYTTGERYEGDWYEDRPSGMGTLTLPDGSAYTGAWKDGKKDGTGTLRYACGDQYKGNWRDDQPSGYGVFVSPNRCFEYRGEWQGGLMSGQGKLRRGDGSHYHGAFAKGQRHGQGTMHTSCGDIYVGEWRENRKHGRGIYTWLVQSRPELVAACGASAEPLSPRRSEDMGPRAAAHAELAALPGRCEIYEGQWVNDMREGQGKMQYADGSAYSGAWRANVRHGNGVMEFPSSIGHVQKYDGEWAHDQRHGRGTLYFNNGYIHHGSFRLNIPFGQSQILTSANGSKLHSKFELGVPRGKSSLWQEEADGTLVKRAGTIRDGMLIEDKTGHHLDIVSCMPIFNKVGKGEKK